MSWRSVWDKRRIGLSQAGGLVLFLFARPVSPGLFRIGLAAIAAGELLRIWAAGHIRKGKALACDGPYALVRNPLYLGSLLLSAGFALICTSARHWAVSAAIWGAVAFVFGFLYAEKIAMEEADLAKQFGPAFEEYRRRVPAMLPDLSGLRRALAGASFSPAQAIKNKEHRTVLAILGLLAFLRFRLIYRL